MPFNSYRPDLMGTAAIDAPDSLVTGDWTSIALTYTAGKFGIDDLGSIKVSFRSATDHTRFQTADPSAPGFVTAAASNGAPLKVWYESNRNVRPWHHTLYVQCLRFLSEGDRITVQFGDRSQGSKGFRLQTFCEDRFQFRVHVDPFATYDYVVLPEAQQPTIRLKAGTPSIWKAVLPTLRSVEDEFSFGVKVEDRWGNPTDMVDQVVRLVPNLPVTNLPGTVHLNGKEPVCHLHGLTCDAPGVLRISVQTPQGDELASSNPMRIVEDPKFRHYWSDMHAQSGETVGTNTARAYFEFGRDRAFLDICAHQGNDFQIDDAFWAHLNDLTAEFDNPGRFLAIPGYEWSGNTSVGGDHNIWYRHERRPIHRAHSYLVADQGTENADCHTAHDLFAKLQGEDVLVVAHVGGRYADISYAHDAKLEPSVEVHSTWGTFEWILEDAFAQGYRVGIVASSDGHKGRPGASYPGASKFGSCGGLTCHLMESLDRDSLFSAFRQRHHYATTGCRAFIDFRLPELLHGVLSTPDGQLPIDDATMGDILTCQNSTLMVDINIEAHAGIERVELRDGLDTVASFQPMADRRRASRRIRIVCEGAEAKGRGRLVNWDVSLSTTGNQIVDVRSHNFWNPDVHPKAEDYGVHWKYVTTGGCHIVDVLLKEKTGGSLRFESNQGSFSLEIDSIENRDFVQNFGGIDKSVRIFRIPEENLPFSERIRTSIDRINDKEHRLYVSVFFEDGHRAWTSPTYVLAKNDQGGGL